MPIYDPATPINETRVVANDFSVTSSTILVDVTGLSVNVVSGRTYTIQVHLIIKSGATAGGVKAAISGTAIATDVRYNGWCMDTGGTPVHAYTQVSALGATVAAASTASDTTELTIYGAVTVNASGTLTVQFAQNSGNATPSVVARGSHFIVRDAG